MRSYVTTINLVKELYALCVHKALQCFLILLISTVLPYFSLRAFRNPYAQYSDSGGRLSLLSGTQEMMVLVFEVDGVWQRILQSCSVLRRLLTLAGQCCSGCLCWQTRSFWALCLALARSLSWSRVKTSGDTVHWVRLFPCGVTVRDPQQQWLFSLTPGIPISHISTHRQFGTSVFNVMKFSISTGR